MDIDEYENDADFAFNNGEYDWHRECGLEEW